MMKLRWLGGEVGDYVVYHNRNKRKPKLVLEVRKDVNNCSETCSFARVCCGGERKAEDRDIYDICRVMPDNDQVQIFCGENNICLSELILVRKL